MTAVPKPRPQLLATRERKAEIAAQDRAENAKVKARSQGVCEVRIKAMRVMTMASTWPGEPSRTVPYVGNTNRCYRRAGHIHHLKSGIGRRNRGDSIKAKCKLHVCEFHHSEIHGHVLKPTDEATRYDAATVVYERMN